MATFYFTYGMNSEKQAYKKGWTEVEADSRAEAVSAYLIYHPKVNGLLPCCSVALTRDEMKEGCNMLEEGNGGVFCHDRITLQREVLFR